MNNGPSSYTAPCYGVVCAQHARCLRYQAVDGMPGHHTAIASCVTRDGARPLFTLSPVTVLERTA